MEEIGEIGEIPSAWLLPPADVAPGSTSYASYAATVAAPLLRQLLELGERYPDLVDHSRRVGDLAAAIGWRMGFSAKQVQRLRLAGVLHDVGKLEMPSHLLTKAEPLDDHEWRQMRKHPEAGYRMIRAAGLKDIAVWVLCHHERPDGCGYPSRRTLVPLGGAVLAVADSFEAMTEARPYKPSLTPGEALIEVARCSGTQFEPFVVAALHDVVASSTAVSASEPEPFYDELRESQPLELAGSGAAAG
jgi:HD-GYP domain-containing protein (c-di-GMP phosphodiesterase class II)